jgi:hypothetical protein
MSESDGNHTITARSALRCSSEKQALTKSPQTLAVLSVLCSDINQLRTQRTACGWQEMILPQNV